MEEITGDGKADRFELTTDSFARPQAKKPRATYSSQKSRLKSSSERTKSSSEGTPNKKPRKPTTEGNGFKPVDKLDFSSDESPQRAFIRPDIDALASPESPKRKMIIPDTGSPTQKTPGSRRSKRRAKGVSQTRDSSPDTPMPSFKMPNLGSVDLGPEPDFARLYAEDAVTSLSDREYAWAKGPVCPMCNEKVDQALLDGFTRNKRMKISEQQRFCQLHQTESAREAWAVRGYPTIDWDRLEVRISKWHGMLEAILEGGPSHFSDRFLKKVEEGKNKTVLKTRDSLTPGYYGSRGLRLMTENIIEQFSSLLRKRAVRDRLISARGYTAYVQAVLVPELTVRLIMEDMEVRETRARAILEDSIGIGELLNEEIGDIVPNEEESDSDALSPLSSIPDSDIIEILD